MNLKILLLLCAFRQVTSISNNTFENFMPNLEDAFIANAVKCIYEMGENLFENNAFITVVDADTIDSPGTEMVSKVLKVFQGNITGRALTTFEITNGTRETFKSFQICVNCDDNDTSTEKVYRNFYQPVRKTPFYLMFADDLDLFAGSLDQLKSSTSYNSSARLIVIYVQLIDDYENATNDMLNIAHLMQNYFVNILMPVSKDTFRFYQHDVFTPDSDYCGESPQLILQNVCQNGKFLTDNFTPEDTHLGLNCTIKTLLMKVPPFVIDETQGIEIEILKAIGGVMNLSFEFTVNDRDEDWGNRLDNGSWTGFLSQMYGETFMIGIGCVSLRQDRIDDFTYSRSYLLDRVVWVVPAAARLDPWMLILIIFEVPTWLAILASFFVLGISFYLAAHWNPAEHGFWKEFSSSILSSFSILLSASVWKQPETFILRVLFITWTFAMIIVNCTYQSALYRILSLPQFEHQIDSYDEVYDSGIGIGGIEAFHEVFHEEGIARSMDIYNNYEIYDKVNDTMQVWLLTVAQDRDTITVLSELYTRYYLSKKSPLAVNKDGSNRVFVVAEPIMSDPLSIIFTKGFILNEPINRVIESLIHSGLIRFWTENLLASSDGKPDDFDEGALEEEEADTEIVITLVHVQGAFFAFALGCLSSLLVFLVEFGYDFYLKRQRAKMRRRRQMIRFMRGGFKTAYHDAVLKEKW